MAEYKTSLKPADLGSNLNSLQYIIRNQVKDMVNTLLVVKVTAVYDNTIDVQTVLKDLSDSGQVIDTFTIPSVRYMRWQYGSNAIIAKPKVGDVGLLLISKQDLSGLTMAGLSVCQTNSAYNIGDGIYIGGLVGMNTPATQTITFEDNKITVTGTGEINLNATTANVNATTINLGGANGLGVARIGGKVTSNGQPNGPTVGFIAEGSLITKSL